MNPRRSHERAKLPEDGIEIHFDEKRGHLQLGCEPDAFAPYREVARSHLKDFPEIPVEKVVEMNIVDTATFVSRRDTPRRRFWDVLIVLFALVVLTLAAVGAYALITRKIA